MGANHSHDKRILLDCCDSARKKVFHRSLPPRSVAFTSTAGIKSPLNLRQPVPGKQALTIVYRFPWFFYLLSNAFRRLARALLIARCAIGFQPGKMARLAVILNGVF